MTKPLSPAAQAVVDAWDAKLNPDPDGLTYLAHDPERESLAAALLAAADQVVPAESENEDLDPCNPDDKAEWAQYSQRQHTRLQLLAIAAELKANS